MLRDKIGALVELTHIYFSWMISIISFSAAVFGARGLPTPWLTLVTVVAPLLGGSAGIAANDYFHRKIDAIEKPWRPIPSGRIGPRAAFAFALLLAGVALALTLTLNYLCYIAAAGVVFFTLMYNIKHKFRFLGPVTRAMTDVFTVIYGYCAVTGYLSLELLPLSLIFFTDVISSNIGPSSVKDVKGDEAGGVLTAVSVIGSKRAAKIGFLFLLISIALGIWSGLLGLNMVFLASFVLARIPSIWAYYKLVETPIPINSEFALATQLFNRCCYALAFPAGVLPVDSGVILGVAIVFSSFLSVSNYYTYLVMERFERRPVK